MNENKIILLGTGCAIPNKLRNPPGTLISYKDNINILLDMGSGISRRVNDHISILDIKYIIISHFHIDHISDLFYFLKANYMLERKEQLTIIGAKGLNQLYNKWLDTHDYMKPHLDFVKIKEIAPKTPMALSKNIEIQGIEVPHGKFSLAFLIKRDDFKIIYSGDTGFSQDLIAFAKNADILIHECSLTDEGKSEIHVTPTELSQIAKKTNVKKLIATHFYPFCDLHLPDIEYTLKQDYDGEVVIGADDDIIYF